MRLSTLPIIAALLVLTNAISYARQTDPQETPQQTIARLKSAVSQAQAQVEASQQQLLELQKSLAALEARLGQTGQSAPAPAPAVTPSPDQNKTAQVEDLHERQAMQESQIATLDQSKLESESKYPVKVSGLVLFSASSNTSQVDQPSVPTLAYAGAGSTAATLRQTILGIDARGPTLAGASSRADLRVDFFGASTQNTYANVGGLLRFRTAHATLDWQHTQAFVELDRPIISPNTPSSLTAVAVPALAWSGNLWSWVPQFGVSHSFDLGKSSQFSVAAALVDVPDAPTSPVSTATQAQQSRWPGTELHLGYLTRKDGPAVGVGGYFSPHKTSSGLNYNAWAGTLDLRLPLPARFDLSGSFYRGAALGGLGDGAYKDYLFYYDGNAPYALALDDVGGWAQLKKTAGPRLEFNGAFGIDNAFSHQVRAYAGGSSAAYQGLARNRTFFANAIYSPMTYLMFSLEYRHISTVPVFGSSADTNVIGLAAGYRF